MSQPFRVEGGLVDRESLIHFRFNGRELKGYPGDTVASALLANGLRLVGRSFKYHRPRGIFSAGSEEPNALVTLHDGARTEPNTRATVAELFDGLEVRSQNHRGSLNHDLLAVNDWLSPFLSAGFYYKTFMWPRKFWEKVYEPAIRAAAGLGRLSGEPDPDSYDKGYLHCDLLIVGGGPAGLSAGLRAGRSGARVILADEDFQIGGRLNAETLQLDGRPGHEWAVAAAAELASMPNVRLLPRTTVFGAYDHGIYGALERRTDHLADGGDKPRQVLWRIYARRTVLAAGATERSIGFGMNDRPGVMLAGAVRAYVNRYGVAPGKAVAIFTNNDDGWRTATDLAARGIQIVAVIDSREKQPLAAPRGATIVMGASVVSTSGRKALTGITLSNGLSIPADCLAVSGGWNPNVHLTCHHRGKPVWRDDIAAFVPGGEIPPGLAVAGAANGSLSLSTAMAEGSASAARALSDLGLTVAATELPRAEDEPHDISALWHVAASRGRAWVDLQNDVTVKDVKQSHLEGFRSVEHLKRYTTMGMATDQGRTANVLGLAVLAEVAGKPIAETGTTIFRPPFTPVAISAFAGRGRGKHFMPTRLTPSHKWAEEQGAVFVEAGLWLRAQWYPMQGETHWRESVDREARDTRASVGVCDVSTLGKIEIRGRDATAFINRIYANGFAKLPVGKVRYGLMLREDGFVYDDGTTARLGDNHYMMTTTTANAVLVYRNLEFFRQCVWPGLDVHLISSTDQWAQFSVAGPKARDLLRKIVDGSHDISNDAFPYMACGEITVCGGTPARLYRISFSGELAYEIAVPARYGDALIRELMKAGAEFDVVPYGTEALNVMRIEKGHPAGNELNGQTTARHLGMDRMVNRKKIAVGNVLCDREAMTGAEDLQLMGFRPVDRTKELKAGAHFISTGQVVLMENDQGWMSSVCHSPALGHAVGLGFIRNGGARIGETVTAADPLRGESIEVEIVSAHFVDPEGERVRV